MVHQSDGKILAVTFASIVLLIVPVSSQVSYALPSGGDWTSYTNGYTNSRFQVASTVTSSNVATLKLAWFFATPAAVTSTPAVSNGVAYFSDYGGNIYAVFLSNGSAKWVFHAKQPISSSPLVANGLVYVTVGVYTTTVLALSQKTGVTFWRTTLTMSENAIFSSPQLYQGRLIVGLSENGPETNSARRGSVVALNASTGSVLWSFHTMIGNTGGAGVWSTVTIDPTLNEAYFGTGNSYLNGTNSLYAYSVVAISATAGTLKWYNQIYHDSATAGDQDFGSTPNIFNYNTCASSVCTLHKAVGLGNKNGIYYVFDRTSGALLNQITIGAMNIGSAGFVYQSANTPELFVPSDFVCSCATKGALTAVNPAVPLGSVSWRFLTPGSALYGSVALAPGLAMMVDTNGDLYGISTATGAALFQATLPKGSYGGVTIAEGYVLAPYGVPITTSGGVSAYVLGS